MRHGSGLFIVVLRTSGVQLPVADVDPLAEFQADLAEVCDLLKTQLLVQAHAGFLLLSPSLTLLHLPSSFCVAIATINTSMTPRS
jgi:hypothetical protein